MAASASSSSSSISRARTSLADDVLIEIFSYLPLNSTYKFRCLSKVWSSNLSNPKFMTNWFKINNESIPPWIHYHSIINMDSVMNKHGDGDKSDDNHRGFRNAYHELHSGFMSRYQHLFSFKFLEKKPFQIAKLRLLGSSNGLVLCHLVGQRRRYHVCNPLTQTWVSLPPPPSCKHDGLDIAGIYCEKSSTEASCYKVVRIPPFDTPSSEKFNVDIFSSDLGVWERVEVSCDENVVWRWSRLYNVVTLNGVLFWIDGRKRMIVYNLDQKNKSDEHRCRLINLPDICPGNFLGVSEGWVCYARTRFTQQQKTVSIWVFDEVNWQILHSDISVEDVLAELYSLIGDRHAEIGIVGFSPVNRNVVLLGWKHRVWEFNVQTRIVEELCLDGRHVHDADMMFSPFVLKLMPTVVPPPSWIDS